MRKRRNRPTVPDDQLEAAEAEIIDRSRRIDFYTTEYTVEILVEKMERGDFVIPEYQRELTWDKRRQSRFIESVVMGLPIPFLFFWEMEDGKLEVVDGSQRLRTLQEYIKDQLTLTPLEELPSLTGTRFFDLPASRQRKIMNGSIRGIVLNESADDQARFDMFERINTGSMVANPAEVRRGALRGPFQDLVSELSKLPMFSRLAPVSKKSQRERVPEELVTRFFAYGDGLDEYRDSPKKFIFDYTKKMNNSFNENPENVEIYTVRFTNMLEFIDRVFPDGFPKSSNPNTTPRARFEAISIGVDLALRDRPELFDQNFDGVSEWLESDEFRTVTTSDAANVKSKLINRIRFVADILLNNSR